MGLCGRLILLAVLPLLCDGVTTVTTTFTTTTSTTTVGTTSTFTTLEGNVCIAEVSESVAQGRVNDMPRYQAFGFNLDCRYGGEHLLLPVLRLGNADAALSVLTVLSTNHLAINARETIAGGQGLTPLLMAAANGDMLTVVRKLLDKGADISTRDDRNQTVLHAGAKWQEIVSLLLSRLPEPEDKRSMLLAFDAEGDQPLHKALRGGSTQGGLALLSGAVQWGKVDLARALENTPNGAGKWPAHLTSDATLLSLMEAHGARLDPPDADGALPLHTTARLPGVVSSGSLAIVAKAAANVSDLSQVMTPPGRLDFRDKFGRTPLHYAAAAGQKDTVLWLLERGAAPNAEDSWGQLPLEVGLREGHLFLAIIFETRGGAPLQAAVRLRDITLAQQLIALEGVAPGHRHPLTGRTALFEAAETGQLDFLAFLLDLDVSPRVLDNDHITALAAGALAGQWQAVKFLLDQGAPAAQRLRRNATALHFAASSTDGAGSELSVKWLVNASLSPDVVDADGQTPLHVAKTAEAAAELLKSGASLLRTKVDDGMLPTHTIARAGHAAALGVVLAWHRLVVDNGTNTRRDTPLHVAATAGQKDAVRKLLEWCADVDATNARGQVPEALATGDVVMELRSAAGLSERCQCDCGLYNPGPQAVAAQWTAGCGAVVRCRGSLAGPSDAVSCQVSPYQLRTAIVDGWQLIHITPQGAWDPPRPALPCVVAVVSAARPRWRVPPRLRLALPLVVAAWARL